MPKSFFIAASVTSLISLKIQITQSLIDFYKFYKYQDSELVNIIERLESLAKTFRRFEKTLSSRTFQTNEQNLIKNIEKSIIYYKKLVQKLQNKCKKFNKTSSNEIKNTAKVASRCTIYSFRQNTFQKLNKDITEIQVNFFIALNVLQFNNNQRFQKDANEMKTFLKLQSQSNLIKSL